MKNRTKLFLIAAVSVFVTYGCSNKNIEGNVFDNFDQPLADVKVSISGTSYESKTDNSGKYEIEYAPGTIILNLEKQGYISENRNFNIATKVKFPAEKITLTKIPNGEGAFFVDKVVKDYIALNNGSVRREHIYNEHSSMFTMETVPNYFNYFYCSGDYKPIAAPDNNFDFIISYSGKLNLYRIQREDGYFFSHEEYGMSSKWSADKPTLSSTTKENLLIYSGNLSVGKYCFAAANRNFNYPVEPIFIFEVK